MDKKYTFGIVVVVLVVVAGFFILESKSAQAYPNINSYNGNITLYKSLSCGCCELYSGYFEKKAKVNIEVVSPENISAIKKKYKIPSKMESCHTTVIGHYFVEGHVPLEAIEKLLKEKPDILGIAMPEMASGSPGMPGNKGGDFIIYSVNKDGSSQEFMRI